MDQSAELNHVHSENPDGAKLEGYEMVFPVRDGRILRIVFQGPDTDFEATRFESFFMTLPGAVAPEAAPPTENTEGK